jgi:hypothetical protein
MSNDATTRSCVSGGECDGDWSVHSIRYTQGTRQSFNDNPRNPVAVNKRCGRLCCRLRLLRLYGWRNQTNLSTTITSNSVAIWRIIRFEVSEKGTGIVIYGSIALLTFAQEPTKTNRQSFLSSATVVSPKRNLYSLNPLRLIRLWVLFIRRKTVKRKNSFMNNETSQSILIGLPVCVN